MKNGITSKKFDIHICLVSGQPSPNLTPILSESWKPKQVVLIVTNQMKQQAIWLQEVYKRHHVKSITIPIQNAYSIDNIQEELKSVLNIYHAQSVALNLTGGTKPMAIAAQTVCYFNDIPYFYVNHENNEIQLHTAKGNLTEIPSIRLNINDYLNIHGFSIIEDKTPDNSKAELIAIKNLRNRLAQNASLFSNAIGSLNWLAKQAEDQKSLQIKVPENILADPNFLKLMDDFTDSHQAFLEGKILHFDNESARFFANGGWLEDYVFAVAKRLKLQDLRENLTIEKGERNELDVVFLARNRLHLIECKTKKFMEGRDKGSEVLYKLDSLTALGGLNTKGMLVSFRKLDKHTLQRAKDLRITTIGPEQLPSLQNQISTWISK